MCLVVLSMCLTLLSRVERKYLSGIVMLAKAFLSILEWSLILSSFQPSHSTFITSVPHDLSWHLLHSALFQLFWGALINCFTHLKNVFLIHLMVTLRCLQLMMNSYLLMSWSSATSLLPLLPIHCHLTCCLWSLCNPCLEGACIHLLPFLLLLMQSYLCLSLLLQGLCLTLPWLFTAILHAWGLAIEG